MDAARQTSSERWSGSDSARYSATSVLSSKRSSRDSALSALASHPRSHLLPFHFSHHYLPLNRSLTKCCRTLADIADVSIDQGCTPMNGSSSVRQVTSAQHSAASAHHGRRRSRKERVASCELVHGCANPINPKHAPSPHNLPNNAPFYTTDHVSSPQTNLKQGPTASGRHSNSNKKKAPPAPPPRLTAQLSMLERQRRQVSSHSQQSLTSLNDELDNIGVAMSCVSLNSLLSLNDSHASFNSVQSHDLLDDSRDSSFVHSKHKKINSRVAQHVSHQNSNNYCKHPPVVTGDVTQAEAEMGRHLSKSRVPPQQRRETRQSSFKLMIDSMLNYDSTRAFDRPTVASRPAPAPKPPTPVKARQNSYKLMMGVKQLESSYEKSDKSLDESVVSLEMNLAGMEIIDTSIYSTWPRKPQLPAGQQSAATIAATTAVDTQHDVTGGCHLHAIGDGVATPCVAAYISSEPMQLVHTPLPEQITSPEQSVFPTPRSKKLKSPKSGISKKKRSEKDASFDSSTWPRKNRNEASTTSDANLRVVEDSPRNATKSSQGGYTDPNDKLSWTATFPRRKSNQPKETNTQTPHVPKTNSFGSFQEGVNTDQAHTPTVKVQPVVPAVMNTKAVAGQFPVALVSPPLEPHVVLHAVNTEDVFDKEIGSPVSKTRSRTSLESGASDVSASRPLSQPLYASISAMKHSIAFPQPSSATKAVMPCARSSSRDASRTWYDDATEEDEQFAIDSQVDYLRNQNLAITGYPFDSFVTDSTRGRRRSKRLSAFSLFSTSSSESSIEPSRHNSNRAIDSVSVRSSQISLSAADNISLGSSNTVASQHSHSSDNSFLSKFKAAKKEEGCSKSFGLKKKRREKSVGGPSAVASVLTPVKERVSKKRTRSEESTVVKTLSKPLPSLTSPSHLKRSSAVLDENFDVMTLIKTQPEALENGLSPSRFFVRPTQGNPGEIQKAKRQCIDGVSSSAHRSAPTSKSAMSRHRMRRSTSRLALNSKLSGSTMDVSLLNRSNTEDANPFDCVTSPKSAHTSPYSQLILDNSPKKISMLQHNYSFQSDSSTDSLVVKRKWMFASASRYHSSDDRRGHMTTPTTQAQPPTPCDPKNSPKKPEEVATPHAYNTIKGKPPTKTPKSSAITSPVASQGECVHLSAPYRAKQTRVAPSSHREALANAHVYRSKTAAIKSLTTADVEKHMVVTHPTPMKLPGTQLRVWQPPSQTKQASPPNKNNDDVTSSTSPPQKNVVKHKSVKSMKKSKSGRTETRLRSASTVDLSSAVGRSAFAMVSPLHTSTSNIAQAASNLQQAASMAKSLSNISCLSLVNDSALVVNDSQLSLAKSTECLGPSAAASSSTAHRRRVAKLAFLEEQAREAAASKSRVEERLKPSKIGRSSFAQTPKQASARSLRSASCSSLNAHCNMVSFNGVAANNVGTQV